MTGGYSGIQTTDGGLAALGYLYVSGQQLNFYFVKMNAEGTVGIHAIHDDNALLNIYPNPMNATAVIEFPNPDNKNYNLTMTNINGETVRSIQNITGNQLAIEKGNLSGGIYFIELRGEKTYRGKIVVE